MPGGASADPADPALTGHSQISPSHPAAAENTATGFNASSPGKAGETSVVERVLASVFFLIGGFHFYIFGTTG